MGLYRGDLLPSCYDEWILPERDRLRQLFLQAAEDVLALLEQERDYPAAIAAAQRLLRQDPLHEAAYRQLMRLHALRGDRAAALRVYHSCVTALERELGIEPGAATRSAYEALLQAGGPSETPTGPLTSRGTTAPLLGRKTEWRALQEAWRKAIGGHSQLVILSGEAGIGKTRLAEEMIAWVGRQGMTTASAHCYAAEGRLAYAPVTAWLRADAVQSSLAALDPAWLTEIARLVPEVLTTRPRLPRPIPMTEGWQRQHFFAALARCVLHAQQPLLLLLDDLHWCDPETLEWLHYLLHFDPRARLLLLGTVRSEEALPGHPLLACLGALQREGLLTEIALGPLSTSETASLAEHLLGHQLDPSMSQALYAETEGNPLFVVEIARTGTLEERAAGLSLPTDARSLLTQAGSTLPPTVQSVLATRLAQLSPQAREVAHVAAIIGRAFSFPVLVRASGQEEDRVVSGLDELWQRRIVREQSVATSESYDFSHDKLREQAYASLSLTSRCLLHRRVAEAFEQVHTEDLDAVSGQIATHYERARLPERAIPYYRCAAAAAMRIYANADAIAALQRAVSLLEAGAAGRASEKLRWQEAAATYTSLGDIYAMIGQQQAARQAYQDGLTWVPLTPPRPLPPNDAPAEAHLADQPYLWRARLLRKIASTWNLASDNPLDTFHINAQQLFQEAERVLAQAKSQLDATWIQEWIDLQLDQLLPLRGSLDEMTAIIEKARDAVERYGTLEQRGQFFQAVVARDSERDHYVASAESVAYCRQALTEIQQTDNTSLIGFAHFVLGNRLWWSDQLEEAESEMRSAMHLAEQTGNTRLLTRCLMFLPFILRRRGQIAAVRDLVARALAMPEARNIPIIKGHRAWLAWHDGDLVEAERYGRASLAKSQGQQRANAFRWGGLWPLLGVAFVQEQLDNAIDYVRMLLDPIQQPPPEPLVTPLSAALQVWDTGQCQQAHTLLQQILPLAREMGYL